MQLALTPLSREMSLRIKLVSQKRDAGVAAAGHERGGNRGDGREGGGERRRRLEITELVASPRKMTKKPSRDRLMIQSGKPDTLKS